MQRLLPAMQKSLALIANGSLDELPPTIFSVHQARGLTDRAIEQGLYKPPKNGDDIEGFMAADKAFHDDLVRMVKAAKAGERKAASVAYGDALAGCTSCHQTYRADFESSGEPRPD
jgi:cytochrome c556